MPVRNIRPLRWVPAGLTDTLDATGYKPGGMASLANLIPSPTTRGAFVPRPASVQLPGGTSFYNFPITDMLVLGNYVYGMVSNGSGQDVPFAYNLVTQAYVTISGIVTSGTPNVPNSQSASGNWTPPTVATLGAYVIFTHPGFTGANGYIGWISIATPASPAWASGNITGQPFPSPPTAVAIFGGRAYYAVGNATQASDALLPLQQTNAGQVLTYGDSSVITALAGLPLNNSSVYGGIVQALIVFKGSQNIYQLTGDYSGIPTGWSINTFNVATGTLAPRSVTPTPKGLAFAAPDGIRIIGFDATVSDPLGDWGSGVKLAFQNAQYPSRMCAAFNMQTLRIAVDQTNEYWYNFGLDAWTGPHPIPTAAIASYQNYFIIGLNVPTGNNAYAGVQKSSVIPSSTDTFVEFGNQLSWTYLTSLLPDNMELMENAIFISTLNMSFIGSTPVVTAEFMDSAGVQLATVTITPQAAASSEWDDVVWGDFLWNGAIQPYSPNLIPWTDPIVFKQGQFQATGQSSAGFVIGAFSADVQRLGYVQQVNSGQT